MSEVLYKLQQELKVPKNNTNSFGGYKYRSCEDIVEAVKKILPEGVVLTMSDDMEAIGSYAFVKATATLSKDGKVLGCATGCARDAIEKKGSDASQNTGAASSYARKYALNGLFCIDDTKDADATNDHGKGDKGNGTMSGRLAEDPTIKADMKELGYDPDKIYNEVMAELDQCQDLDMLAALVKKNKESRRMQGLPSNLKSDFTDNYNKLKLYLENKNG